ncbi:hypothetical protein CLAFUW4_03927 [Fulvia fulva]|uniref:Uncharacterized protein n=1 Tax=Passalora fulva TaxID=5499 RepID=A0A9Q8LGQ8_PASFU|nr:uncharacterized protein CLAFUR5_03895 [Fulvia fulva]KAK4627146.1 hypothetical protein CLAFUR4_03913 [Fulvia fulva]KAK4627940.1 hypothetical protein CLAFUR0_03914 [Fulvia fulva]UJO17103.1 hypothetical protein CLAFUR5_03895 [Fulvia fulva]WPV14191.1 hypothetical protein CLAFUW4_03927 [Fulvia fulva]WPV28974.1 hypothetical protein CLAFUW7_03916 [Fulvia fulva]
MTAPTVTPAGLASPQAVAAAGSRSLRTHSDRLSLPLGLRLPLASTIGSFTGFLLGIAKGSSDSGLRFQAENAHRLPSTQTGWYLYHKSKNYNMMLGGIVEGFKQAGKYAVWVGCYFVLEEGVDRGRAAGVRMWRRVFREGEFKSGMRMATAGDVVNDDLLEGSYGKEEARVAGNRDCLSSMLAGLGTAGIFSAWNRFPLPTAARTAKMGAKAGLAFGVLQDMVSLMRGRRVGYVEFVKRHTVGESQEKEDEKMAV